jgi:hypothetical protein
MKDAVDIFHSFLHFVYKYWGPLALIMGSVIGAIMWGWNLYMKMLFATAESVRLLEEKNSAEHSTIQGDLHAVKDELRKDIFRIKEDLLIAIIESIGDRK